MELKLAIKLLEKISPVYSKENAQAFFDISNQYFSNATMTERARWSFVLFDKRISKINYTPLEQSWLKTAVIEHEVTRCD